MSDIFPVIVTEKVGFRPPRYIADIVGPVRDGRLRVTVSAERCGPGDILLVEEIKKPRSIQDSTIIRGYVPRSEFRKTTREESLRYIGHEPFKVKL